MQRKLVLIVSLIIFLFAGFLLFSGAVILTKPFISAIGMPFGTVITWMGLIAFQLIIFVGISGTAQTKFSVFYNIVLKICILLASLWGVFGYILAGNWAYNFSTKLVFIGSEKAAIIFLNYTYLLLVFPLAVLLFYWIHLLILIMNKRMH